MRVNNSSVVGVIACVLLGIFLIRNEARMDRIEAKLDDIILTQETVKYTAKDVECLTKNVYYEAGIENIKGKYAVAHVTLNRVKSGRWGNNICSVVYAKKQFSWTLLSKLPKPDPKVWAESREVAIKSLEGARVHGLTDSILYHADYIRDPAWAAKSVYVGKIGRHKFYNQATTQI